MYRLPLLFCLSLSFFVKAMDPIYYDPAPIFCIWALSHVKLIHKDIRKEIMKKYIQQKVEKVTNVYEYVFRSVKISFTDLIFLKNEFVDGFELLGHACGRASDYRVENSFELTKKEYETVENLPLYFKNKFLPLMFNNKLGVKKSALVKALVDGDEKIISLV